MLLPGASTSGPVERLAHAARTGHVAAMQGMVDKGAALAGALLAAPSSGKRVARQLLLAQRGKANANDREATSALLAAEAGARKIVNSLHSAHAILGDSGGKV